MTEIYPRQDGAHQFHLMSFTNLRKAEKSNWGRSNPLLTNKRGADQNRELESREV